LAKQYDKMAQRAIQLVMQLMAVPGKSCEESAIAQEVISVLTEAGVPSSAIQFDNAHKRTPAPGQVGNLIVRLPGQAGLPRIMLSAHLDTVPICVGCQPKRQGGAIISANQETGLGADDRAGVAAVLHAAIETLHSNQPHPPLTLCFFVQEEIGLQGSRNLTVSKLGKPSLAVNFDGGDPFKLTVGATGGERLKVVLRGHPAHAGLSPEEGASAIHAAGLAIASLHKSGWLGRIRKQRKDGTSNIGVIHGGSATNVVADAVEIQAEARSHDSAFRLAIADAIEQAFVAAASSVVSCRGLAVTAQVERRVDYESFRLEPGCPATTSVEQAVIRAGGSPTTAVTNGGIDANWLVKHGIPTVTLGCGQRNVHTKHESLDISDFLAACEIARGLLAHAS
jgi:tripeptide aminopeptidase